MYFLKPESRKALLEFLRGADLIRPMLQLLVADPDGARALVGSFADGQ